MCYLSLLDYAHLADDSESDICEVSSCGTSVIPTLVDDFLTLSSFHCIGVCLHRFIPIFPNANFFQSSIRHLCSAEHSEGGFTRVHSSQETDGI